MKKREKNFIILILALIIFLGLYLMLTNFNKMKEMEEINSNIEETIELTSLDKSIISELSYKNSKISLNFIKIDDTWYYKDDESLSITQSAISNMINNVYNIKAKRQVEENITNLANYGLDKPAYTIILKAEDGTETHINIGIKNSVTGDFYAYIKGIEGVYTIGNSISTYFDYELMDLVQIKSLPTVEATVFTSAIITREDEELELKLIEAGSDYDVSQTRVWFIGKPYEYERAVDTSVLEEILTQIGSLAYSSMVKDKITEEDLLEYELKEPLGKIHYTYVVSDTTETGETKNEEVSVTLYIGNETEDAFYYVLQEGAETIFLMDKDSVNEILELTSNQLLNKYFAMVNIKTVDSVEIEVNGESYHLEVFHEEETTESETTVTNTYYYDGEEVDLDKSKSFYTSLIGIKAEKIIEDPETISDSKPILKIKFNRNTSVLETLEVEYALYNTAYYQVTINGETEYLVNKRDLESYIEIIETYFEEL